MGVCHATDVYPLLCHLCHASPRLACPSDFEETMARSVPRTISILPRENTPPLQLATAEVEGGGYFLKGVFLHSLV